VPGYLNSHRRFFLSYASPVVWNGAIVAALLIFRRADMAHLAVYASWGSVIGSGLQIAVQLPVVLKLAPALRLFFGAGNQNVRTVIGNFVPVLSAGAYSS